MDVLRFVAWRRDESGVLHIMDVIELDHAEGVVVKVLKANREEES